MDVPVEEEDAIASTVKYTLGRLLLVGTLIGKQNPLGGPCEGEGGKRSGPPEVPGGLAAGKGVRV